MYRNVDEFETAIAEPIPLPEESWELDRTISCLRIGSNAVGAVDGETATGTVRVECPETGLIENLDLVADFVRAPRAGRVSSGSLREHGKRWRRWADSSPGAAGVRAQIRGGAPTDTRVGLVRFATDESAGAPMTDFGPEGTDPAGREVILHAIADHTLPTGDASWIWIGDGVFHIPRGSLQQVHSRVTSLPD